MNGLSTGEGTESNFIRKPKPHVDVPPIQNNTNPADLIGKTRSMLDLIHLAIQTDSTRLITPLLLGKSARCRPSPESRKATTIFLLTAKTLEKSHSSARCNWN